MNAVNKKIREAHVEYQWGSCMGEYPAENVMFRRCFWCFDFLGQWSKSREFMSPASIRNRGVHGCERGCNLHGFPMCGHFSTKEIPTSSTGNAKAIHLH